MWENRNLKEATKIIVYFKENNDYKKLCKMEVTMLCQYKMAADRNLKC